MVKPKTLAQGFTFLFLIIAFILILLTQTHLPSNLNPYFFRLLRQPLDPQINQTLALKLTQLQSQLASQFIQRASLLSTESDWQQLNTTLQHLESQHTNLQNQIKYWQNLDLKYPNFSTLKLILAALYLKNHKPHVAQQYLNQVKQLDPNNPLINQIQQLINTQ